MILGFLDSARVDWGLGLNRFHSFIGRLFTHNRFPIHPSIPHQSSPDDDHTTKITYLTYLTYLTSMTDSDAKPTNPVVFFDIALGGKRENNSMIRSLCTARSGLVPSTILP